MNGHYYIHFGNHWWSLQSDSLSAVWFIHKQHLIFCCNLFWKHVISVLNHLVFCSVSHHFCFKYKMRCKSLFFLLFNKPATIVKKNIGTDWILWFQNGCNKVVIELCIVQFWFESIIVISNQTCATRLSDLEIMVWFQTKLHSTQFNYYTVCLILQLVQHSFEWVINQLVSPCGLWQKRLLTWKYFNMQCATDQTKKDMPFCFIPAMDILPFRFLLLEEINTNTVLKSPFKLLRFLSYPSLKIGLLTHKNKFPNLTD